MRRVAGWVLNVSAMLALAACVSQQYRFERIDGERSSELPLKFVSLSGVRDGDSVRADLKFGAGADSALLKVVLHLGPPAQFTTGSWHVNGPGNAGNEGEGNVTCDSLTYLGGQGDVPSMGGSFILRDSAGRAVYRVTMPPTPIARRVSF